MGTPALAQPVLNCDEFLQVPYVGHQVQDFIIPNLPGGFVEFTLSGADGGDARLNFCAQWDGGEGATLIGRAPIGWGPNALNPGGRLRFIVGQRGENDIDTGVFLGGANGAGGGGTGILYDSADPGVNFVGLAVAGAGGGAYASVAAYFCQPNVSFHGNPGSTDSCSTGADLSPWGCEGNGGGNGDPPNPNSGEGGGLYSAGENDNALDGKAGLPNGGAGGNGGDNSIVGGWGCGGGAGVFPSSSDRAGGGGYSGGNNNEITGRGGGTWVNPDFGVMLFVEADSPGYTDGHAKIVVGYVSPNPDPLTAAVIVDDAPFFSPTVCGLAATGLDYCGTAVPGNDLWYTYTNTDACTRDIVISVAGSAQLYAYDGTGGFDPDGCRGTGTGSYTDTLAPGERIYLRAVPNDASGLTLTATSSYAAGQVDCDFDGIPDACDTFDDCPPPNDLLVNEIDVADGGVYLYDTLFAGNEATSSCTPPGTPVDIWYTFTAQADGQLVATLDSNGPSIAAGIGLFDISLRPVEIACDRDLDARFDEVDSGVVLPMKGGEIVAVRVATVGGGGNESGTMMIAFDESFTNDRCADALQVFAPDGASAIVPLDLFAAEVGPGTGSSCGSPSAPTYDAWYTYTATYAETVRFAMDRAAFVLSAYDACGGTELDCAIGFGSAGPELTLDLDAGATVQLQAALQWAQDDWTGIFTIDRTEPCPGDLDGDGAVSFNDLIVVLSSWGACVDCPADFDGSGSVDFTDLITVLSAWGPCL